MALKIIDFSSKSNPASTSDKLCQEGYFSAFNSIIKHQASVYSLVYLGRGAGLVDVGRWYVGLNVFSDALTVHEKWDDWEKVDSGTL